MNSDYDLPDAFQQDSDIQVESSLPYGVQNVYAVAGRLARSRNNRHKVSYPTEAFLKLKHQLQTQSYILCVNISIIFSQHSNRCV